MGHALASGSELPAAFVTFLLGRPISIEAPNIFVQQLPGASPVERLSSSEEASPSVPDMCIVGTSGERSVCLVVECKVEAKLEADQLRKHLAGARKRGYQEVHVIAITPRDADRSIVSSLGEQFHYCSWPEVYLWMHENRSNNLVRTFTEYLAIVEAEAREKGSLEEMLTDFTGIPFEKIEQPYKYEVAKSALRWLRGHLATTLQNHGTFTGLAPQKKRPSITDDGDSVWDVIGTGPKERGFTEDPHFGVVVSRSETGLELTIPNNARAAWKHLKSKSLAEWETMFAAVDASVRSISKSTRSPVVPRVELHQRHFLARRKQIRDASMEFNIAVQVPEKTNPEVKHVAAWLPGLKDIVSSHGQANMQLTVKVAFPYGDGSIVHRAAFKDTAVIAIAALRPFFDFASGAQ